MRCPWHFGITVNNSLWCTRTSTRASTARWIRAYPGWRIFSGKWSKQVNLVRVQRWSTRNAGSQAVSPSKPPLEERTPFTELPPWRMGHTENSYRNRFTSVFIVQKKGQTTEPRGGGEESHRTPPLSLLHTSQIVIGRRYQELSLIAAPTTPRHSWATPAELSRTCPACIALARSQPSRTSARECRWKPFETGC